MFLAYVYAYVWSLYASLSSLFLVFSWSCVRVGGGGEGGGSQTFILCRNVNTMRTTLLQELRRPRSMQQMLLWSFILLRSALSLSLSLSLSCFAFELPSFCLAICHWSSSACLCLLISCRDRVGCSLSFQTLTLTYHIDLKGSTFGW